MKQAFTFENIRNELVKSTCYNMQYGYADDTEYFSWCY